LKKVSDCLNNRNAVDLALTVAVQLSFHQIEEALSWREDLDLVMLELAALMTISVKETYASSGSSKKLRGM
jgi:hypothetical protein